MGSKVLHAWQILLSSPSIRHAPFCYSYDDTFAKWGHNTRSKSGLRVTDQYANGRLGVRPQKIRLGPCRQLSSLFIAPTTSLKRDFDILKKTLTMYHQQMHNALSAYNLWTKEMLLRCLRTTEKYKLMGTRQIRITRNQILKNIQSLSTERVFHDLAGLFVYLCVSTCNR